MYYKTLDDEIALYPHRTGKTQAQLAEEVGMASNTVSWKRRGERGKEFSLGEVVRVARAIGLTSIDGLLSDVRHELEGAVA